MVKSKVDGRASQEASVRSVERSAAILGALADQPMSIAEAAARVDLHTSTVHRLLGTLVKLGWVEQSARTARYRLAPGLLGLSALGLAPHPLLTGGHEVLRSLTDTFGYSCWLSVRVGRKTVALARAAGRLSGATAANYDFRVGRSHPAHTTADGKVLLAYLPNDERGQLLGGEPLERYTERTITDLPSLEKELEIIRAKGYATDTGERWDFLRGVAVPVSGPRGRVSAAIVCLGRFELDEENEKISQEMKLQVEALSERLNNGEF